MKWSPRGHQQLAQASGGVEREGSGPVFRSQWEDRECCRDPGAGRDTSILDPEPAPPRDRAVIGGPDYLRPPLLTAAGSST